MKKTKILLSSILTIMLCVSLITGATFALFTSEDHVNIAITSGKVEVEARVGAVAYASDTTDTYTEWTDAVDVDGVLTGTFANKGTVGYDSAENKLTLNNITPGDAVKFTVDIYNRSTVAAKYSVRIGASEDADDIFKYFKVTKCGKEGESEDEVLTGSPIVVSEWAALDVPTAEEAVDSIELIIALPSAVTSEQADDKSCTVALTVVAVQANGQTCADTGIHNYVDDVCTWCGAANPYASLAHDESGENYIINEAPAPEDGHLVIPGMINGKNVEIAASTFKGREDITDVTLGDGIASVGVDAFRGCSNLTSVTLGDGLETLGGMAFRETSIKQIDIPDSVKEIGGYAFCLDSNLTDVELPADLETIGSGAFAYCKALKNCDLSKCTNLKKIGTNAFAYTVIEDITLPEGLGELGSGSFSFCASLTNATLPESITKINSAAFYQCTALEEVNIPSNVTYIGPMAFEETKITNVTFPDGLTEIGYQAFYNCKDLESIILPDTVTKIGEMAFCNCERATTIKLSSSLTVIPKWSFQYCKSVTELIIPNSVKEIGFNAFVDCDALSEITIPASVTTIVEGAFIDYHGALKVDPGNEIFEVSEDGNLLINKKTKTLLWAKSDVETVTIPTDVERIGDYAFDTRTSLTDITIPANVKEIGVQAFHGCTSLDRIELNIGITSIGSGAFGATAYYEKPENWSNSEKEKGVLYMAAGGNEHFYLITAYNITDMSGVLDKTVVIADSAFSNSSAITELTIPENVTAIGRSAFSSCGELANVIVPDTVKLLGENAFSKSTEITFEPSTSRYSVVEMDNWSYIFDDETDTLLWAKLGDGCTSVTIPEAVKKIGYRAFAGTAGLTEVVIEAGVTEIADEAFSGCASITSVTVKGATYIDENAFGSCKGLATVNFENVEEGLILHKDAFSGCSGITTINFSGSRDRWLEVMKLNDSFVTLSQQIKVVYDDGSMVIVSAEIQ